MEFLNEIFNCWINLSKWIIWTDPKVSQTKFKYLAFIQDSPILEKGKTNIQKVV